MSCYSLKTQAEAYISEYKTIRKNFNAYVAKKSYDAKARQYEADMDRVVGLLQGIHDEMEAQNCAELDQIVGWPSGVTL